MKTATERTPMVQQEQGDGIVIHLDNEELSKALTSDNVHSATKVAFGARTGLTNLTNNTASHQTSYGTGSYQQESLVSSVDDRSFVPLIPSTVPITLNNRGYSDCSTSSAQSSGTRRRRRQLLTNSSKGGGKASLNTFSNRGVTRKSSNKKYNITRKKSASNKRYAPKSSLSWLSAWTSNYSFLNMTNHNNNNEDYDLEVPGADIDNNGGDENDVYDDDEGDDDHNSTTSSRSGGGGFRSRRMFDSWVGTSTRGHYRQPNHHQQRQVIRSYRYPFFGLCGIVLLYVVLVVVLGTVQTKKQQQQMSNNGMPTSRSFLQYLNPFSSICNDGATLLSKSNSVYDERYAKYYSESVLLKALSEDDDKENDFVVAGRKNGVVASDQGICSEMGMRILRDHNGTAVDAAITTALCIGVVNPSSSGIGGGAFMLIHTDASKSNSNGPMNPNVNKIPPYHDAREENDKGIDNGEMKKIRTKDNDKVTTVIDAREIAPSKAFVEMYLNTTVARASVYGGLAIPVPGELRGLELAHALYGTLPWRTVVEPVVELVSDGIPVSKYLAHVIQNMANNAYGNNTISYNPAWGIRKLITRDDTWDTPLVFGEKIHNPALVETFRDVLEHGADALYTGERAEQLANDIQNAGGIVTAEDIIQYQPTIRSPIVATNVNGFTIVGVPPPSSGGAVVIGAIRFLGGFIQPLATFAETLAVHRIVEAMKHVFSIRMSLSDPAYNSHIVEDAVHDLTIGPYMDELRKTAYKDNETCPSISMYGGEKWSQLEHGEGKNVTVKDAHEGDRRRHRNLAEKNIANGKKDRRRLYRTDGYLNDHGTSHFSVLDKFGNAVSMTTSVNTIFGSLVVSPSTGVLLGNTMDDFANPGLLDFFGIKPSEANFIQPGKKPLSSMSPTLVFQHHVGEDDSPTATNNNNDKKQSSPVIVGDLILVIGGSGGPKIITAVLQVILNHIWFGKTLLESIIYPRVHDQLIYHGGSVTTLERATLDHIIDNTAHDVLIEVSNRTVNALVSRNHEVTYVDYPGCVQAISIDLETNTYTGASDPRKGGYPAGY